MFLLTAAVTVFYKSDKSKHSVSLALIMHVVKLDLCILALKFYYQVTVIYAGVCAFIYTAAFLLPK